MVVRPRAPDVDVASVGETWPARGSLSAVSPRRDPPESGLPSVAMATPTAAELDAILDAVLVGGARKAAELKASQPLCFGYKTADGRVGPVVFMPNKSDGAGVVENKCDASLLSGRPSRETRRAVRTTVWLLPTRAGSLVGLRPRCSRPFAAD